MSDVNIDAIDQAVAEFRNRNSEEPKYILLPAGLYNNIQFQLQMITSSISTPENEYKFAFYKDMMIFKTQRTPNIGVYSYAEFHNIVQSLLYHTGI